jgi:hypothetical protein
MKVGKTFGLPENEGEFHRTDMPGGRGDIQAPGQVFHYVSIKCLGIMFLQATRTDTVGDTGL